MPEIIDPSVADISPNLYNAARISGLSPQSAKFLNQMSKQYNKGKELLKLSEPAARNKFLELDPKVQENIRLFFPNQRVFEEEKGAIRELLNTWAKGVMFPVLQSVLFLLLNVHMTIPTLSPFRLFDVPLRYRHASLFLVRRQKAMVVRPNSCAQKQSQSLLVRGTYAHSTLKSQSALAANLSQFSPEIVPYHNEIRHDIVGKARQEV